MLLDQSGYEDGVRSIENEMNSVYNDTYAVYQSFQLQADIDTRFAAGDQSLYGRFYQNLVNPSEHQFNFNHIMRILNMISGYQIRNRKSPQILGQENSDDQTASQLSALNQWTFQHEGFYDMVSETFRQSLTTGFGAIELYLDPRSDPVSPDIKGVARSYNSIIFDPYFKKKDMSDASFIWGRSYLTPMEVKQMMKGRDKDIDSLLANGSYKDEKFQYMMENWNLKPSNLMAVDSYYHLTTRKAKMFYDIYSGDAIEIEEDLDRETIKFFLKQNERLEYIVQDIPSVKLATAVNGRVLYTGNPMKLDTYPIIPCFAYINPAAPMFSIKLQGVTRSIRDVQFLFNRRKRTELDIIESRGTSTLMIMQGTLVDDRQAFQTGQGRALFVKRDAPQGLAGIQPLPAPNVGPDMLQLSSLLREEMVAISGVNEELLGSASDDVAGILSMLRQGAGLTTLQVLFDNVDYFQSLLSGSIMKLQQTHWKPSKVRRILNEEPSPQFKNKAFQKYDSVVINGQFSAEQRQMEFVQLLEIQKMGIPVPIERLLEATTVQNKDKLIAAIKQQQEAQQKVEQQKMALELEQIKAQNELVRARTLADSGLGVERISRIQENKMFAVERGAQAQKDIESANLDSIKAIKELQSMEFDQFVKAYNLYKLIEKENAMQAEASNSKQEVDMGMVQDTLNNQKEQQNVKSI